VLSRAHWSSRKAAAVLLGLLVRSFAPSGPLIVGIDETLERRQGEKIGQKGIYHLPGRRSLQQELLRPVQRLAMDQSDAAGSRAMGRSGLGAAFLLGIGAFGAL
jgi:hypothetical protein